MKEFTWYYKGTTIYKAGPNGYYTARIYHGSWTRSLVADSLKGIKSAITKGLNEWQLGGY